MTRPEFDAKDAEILANRERLYNLIPGPRVGDFLEIAEDVMLRFTHDWGESIQTTVWPKHPCHGDASFYLSDGYVSFSGSLDRAIDKGELEDTGRKLEAAFWFFHHNHAGADCGVYCKMPVRVWKRTHAEVQP
jgi:hypothetical protein